MDVLLKIAQERSDGTVSRPQAAAIGNGLACLIITTCRVSTGYVVNPVRDQVNKENEYFPVPVSA